MSVEGETWVSVFVCRDWGVCGGEMGEYVFAFVCMVSLRLGVKLEMWVCMSVCGESGVCVWRYGCVHVCMCADIVG